MNTTLWTPTLGLFAVALACFAAAAITVVRAADLDVQQSIDGKLPAKLQDTGIDAKPDPVEFTPHYPLWTDGAAKARRMRLPAGTAIDASKPDAWRFPRGTKFWKDFSFGGRKVETRYIEHGTDGKWRFGTYVWNEAGTEATLAPYRGTEVKVAGAPQGRYAIPSRGDCIACHGSTTVPVLGASALQLSSELRSLVARGLVRGLPDSMLRQPPEIAATTPVERAALGYLHGNCAHCHNPSAWRVPLPLTLQQRAADPAGSRDEVLRSTVRAESRWRPADDPKLATVLEPGVPDGSVLLHRMQSRNPRVQMPPLGTAVADEEGIAMVRRWIASLPSHPKENP